MYAVFSANSFVLCRKKKEKKRGEIFLKRGKKKKRDTIFFVLDG
jgi:hypothetical protein